MKQIRIQSKMCWNNSDVRAHFHGEEYFKSLFAAKYNEIINFTVYLQSHLIIYQLKTILVFDLIILSETSDIIILIEIFQYIYMSNLSFSRLKQICWIVKGWTSRVLIIVCIPFKCYPRLHQGGLMQSELGTSITFFLKFPPEDRTKKTLKAS